MNTVLSMPVAIIPTSVHDQPADNHNNDALVQYHSGRAVNEISNGHNKIAGTMINSGKECGQNGLNPSHSEWIDLQWQSHCQFYADCTDCQRLGDKPHMDKTRQDAGVNTTESCKRIKRQNNIQRRISAEPPVANNQKLVTQ